LTSVINQLQVKRNTNSAYSRWANSFFLIN
jgi:hypothetical protein